MLVQPEMQRGRSPSGDPQGIGVFRSDEDWKQRKNQDSALWIIVSISPASYPRHGRVPAVPASVSPGRTVSTFGFGVTEGIHFSRTAADQQARPRAAESTARSRTTRRRERSAAGTVALAGWYAVVRPMGRRRSARRGCSCIFIANIRWRCMVSSGKRGRHRMTIWHWRARS
jgi:hypothetical protein